nr:ankyrin repeat domain containing protein [Mimivirus sp.]
MSNFCIVSHYEIGNKFETIFNMGLNITNKPKIINGHIHGGFRYSSISNIFNHAQIGAYVMPIVIPNDATVYSCSESDKWWTDRIIVLDKMLLSDINTIKYLINNGAIIKEMCKNLLFWACEKGYLDIIQYILSLDINLLIENSPKAAKLAKLGPLAIYKYLTQDKSLDCFNMGMKLAVRHGNLNIIQYFVSIGENIREDIKGTCITCACHHGHTNIVSYLINNGANIWPFIQDCIMAATIYGYNDLIIYIVSLGFNVYSFHKDCINNMLKFNSKENLGHIQYLTSTYTDPAIMRKILFLACRRGHIDTVKYLINVGIIVDDRCKSAAIKSGNIALINFLDKFELKTN